MAIDIGAEAKDRSTYMVKDWTMIEKSNPANASGTITSVEIWAKADITGLIVGTFYVVSGNTLKCRDSEAITGTITAGSKVTKAVSIAVEAGDYIGLFFTAGEIEYDSSGYIGIWGKSGKYIDPADEVEYNWYSEDQLSLYGIGDDVVAKGASRGYIIGD